MENTEQTPDNNRLPIEHIVAACVRMDDAMTAGDEPREADEWTVYEWITTASGDERYEAWSAADDAASGAGEIFTSIENGAMHDGAIEA